LDFRVLGEGIVSGQSNRRRKHPLLRAILIGLCSVVYAIVSTAALVLYGPFDNLRRVTIGAVLTSSHPWVIKPFYSAATLQKYHPVSIDKMSKPTMHAMDYSKVHNSGIQVIPIRTDKFEGSLMIIRDPKRVHVGVTKNLGNIGETVTGMVADAHAIAGINAGGFSDGVGHGTGGRPLGITVSRGKFITNGDSGSNPVIGITNDGALIIGQYTIPELHRIGIEDAVCYGPQLVKDGKPFLTTSDGSWGIAPRSAIGQRKDGAIMLLALSGRGNGGLGASLTDCEQVMLQYGAVQAANLDGGYSTELYYNKHFLVTPSNPLGERYVATSFVVDGEPSS
jgi:exopolysaccharide biosynthesis protein